MKVNKYFLFAIVYFFINSLGLPIGLTYTAILSPLFYWWILVAGRKEVILPFLMVLMPFIIFQVLSGVDTESYLISLLYYLTVYIFCHAFYTFLKKCHDIEGIFRKILIINFFFCLVAIPLYFTPYYDILWIEQYLTEGVNDFRRLKLFTYEASYYSTLFIPLVCFYFFKIILGLNRQSSWLILLMIILPLALSFSIGVISAVLVALMITVFLYARTLIRKRRTRHLVFICVSAFFGGLILLTFLFPDNALFVRIGNIFAGEDLSSKGRTSDSFILADKILELKSHLWGIGPGQLKIIGNRIIHDYYAYPDDYNVIAIPNAAAETWAVFGWLGLLLRISLEMFFFYRTKVWTNYFRLTLFLFVFLYQFTGSFITNLAEYVIWILAFTNIFPQFDVIFRPNSKSQRIKE
ncbi:hypothetical protein ACX0G9_11365 [Flavitalea flava]